MGFILHTQANLSSSNGGRCNYLYSIYTVQIIAVHEGGTVKWKQNQVTKQPHPRGLTQITKIIYPVKRTF